MRFIGNKERVLDTIFEILEKEKIKGSSFFDFFSGTANVGKYFKKRNYEVHSSDIMYFSYVLQKAYIETNNNPDFSRLLSKLNIDNSSFAGLEKVIDYLNKISPKKGFIFKNYTPEGSEKLEIPRMYFSSENGAIIDAIRWEIDKWKKQEIISEEEFYILLACLIESAPFYANISGVYAAFQKKWDSRALKKFKLRNIELIANDKNNKSYNGDSLDLVSNIDVDILYLDPPYNQRQYAPNYHILETIAKHDNPEIKGITGMRNYDNQKSSFCNKEKAIISLSKIAKNAKYKTLLLSYNSEGIMNEKDIIKTLEEHGNVKLVEFQYLRFKSNNNGDLKNKKYIKEQLYILKK